MRPVQFRKWLLRDSLHLNAEQKIPTGLHVQGGRLQFGPGPYNLILAPSILIWPRRFKFGPFDLTLAPSRRALPFFLNGAKWKNSHEAPEKEK